MQIRGKLSDRSAADLIEWLHTERRTGVLRFWHAPGPLRKDVYFEKGEIISSGTSEPREFLGSYLIASGKITEHDFVRAYRTQVETKVLFGKVLAMFGKVSEAEVEVALKGKTEETIWDVFLWREGVFEFDDSATLFGPRLPIRIDERALIDEGERRVIEWGIIRQTFPTLLVDVEVTGKSAPGASALEKKILEEIAKRKSIAQIALEMRLSPFLFLRRLHEYHKKGIVRVIGMLPEEMEIPDGAIAPLTNPGIPIPDGVAVPSIQAADPGVSETQRFTVDGESINAAELKARLPVLKIPQSEMMRMKFNAEEGYLLSRVDGVFDVATVATLCPFRESLALSLLCGLATRGIITLQKA